MQKAALRHPSISLPTPDGIESEDDFRAYVNQFRAAIDNQYIVPLSERLAQAFPVKVRHGKISGVPVEEFSPLEGNSDKRVLINLHGGGFFSGAVTVGRVESIPMAYLGKFRVISVDYRQGYEHTYPAASEDVEAVYRELLRDYASANIGIYGGSAGGMLTAQAIAWIIEKGLPAPGVAGVFSSGAGSGGGDGTFFSRIGTAEPPLQAEFARSFSRSTRFGYFSSVMPRDYLANPVDAPVELLSKFPPTLLITATRAFDLSPAIAFHRALSRAGAEASLHVFDGLGHCFYYNAFLPEADDAYHSVIRFFEERL